MPLKLERSVGRCLQQSRCLRVITQGVVARADRCKYRRIEAVVRVLRVGALRNIGRDVRGIGNVAIVFTQVGKGKDVPVIGNGRVGIRYPDFYFGDVDARADNGKAGQGRIVRIVEMLGEEIVLVGFVVVAFYFKVIGLRTALYFYFRLFSFLLGKHAGYREAAELELGLDTEQALAAGDQRTGKRHSDVTGFNTFDDVVFKAGPLQLHFILVV